MTIKEFCKKYDISHEQFARIAGISTRTIRYINNGYKPSQKIDEKIKLAKTFVVTHRATGNKSNLLLDWQQSHTRDKVDALQYAINNIFKVPANNLKDCELTPGSVHRVYDKTPIVVKKDFSLVWLYKVCFLIIVTYFLCYIFSN